MAGLPPPFRSIPGVANFRDLGGAVIRSGSGSGSDPGSGPGGIIRPGLVFRSAEPSKITPDGIAALAALGITHVYDLRSPAEGRRNDAAAAETTTTGAPRWPEALHRVPAPVFRDADYGPEAVALRFRHYASADGPRGFVEAYRGILRSGAGSFAAVLGHLAAPDPAPLLVHCTAGKDRTGVVCALALSLCGVDDEAVAAEYALTELGLAEKTRELKEHLLQNLALRDDVDGALRMMGSRPEAMLATLQMIREEHGSVEGYVRNQCQLSPGSIAQIRRNLIVDAPGQDPSHQQSKSSL